MSRSRINVFCDGGARGNPGSAASAFVVYIDKKLVYKESFFLGKATNNMAEYNAVIMALNWLVKNSDKFIKVSVGFYLDSELVVKQLSGKYKTKNKKLKELFLLVKSREERLECPIVYNHIYRNKNIVADRLLNKELDLH